MPAQWNRYHDFAQATELLQQLVKAFPELCHLENLGSSYGKREMWVLTLTSRKGPAAGEKPAFWIDGGIHANEIQGTEVALYTAWFLAESYGRHALATRLLDERTFYIMPMMSPDSRDAHMYQPNSTHSPRGGQRPVDDDRDGLVDEDKPDDLDGDGHITQMRIRDPNGRFKPHPEYPELMIACKPDERGQYTLLDTEGIDNDGDGKVDEDGDGYYDPNRNWPWSWQPNYVQHGADRYPFSVAEDRMVAEFIMAHPNIAGAQSYHNAGGMILRGPGVKTEHYDGRDLAVYNELGHKGEMMLPGYKYMETSTELYEVFGGELDWLHNMQGIFAFTNELFTSSDLFHRKSEGGFFGKAEDLRQFDKYLLLSEGTVPWHEVDHPQFGKIEVGGAKKSWVRQPPSFMLEAGMPPQHGLHALPRRRNAPGGDRRRDGQAAFRRARGSNGHDRQSEADSHPFGGRREEQAHAPQSCDARGPERQGGGRADGRQSALRKPQRTEAAARIAQARHDSRHEGRLRSLAGRGSGALHRDIPVSQGRFGHADERVGRRPPCGVAAGRTAA